MSKVTHFADSVGSCLFLPNGHRIQWVLLLAALLEKGWFKIQHSQQHQPSSPGLETDQFVIDRAEKKGVAELHLVCNVLVSHKTSPPNSWPILFIEWGSEEWGGGRLFAVSLVSPLLSITHFC